jgi:hypothetical protein
MIFKILGTEMGPIILSDEERQKALPDFDSLFDMYFNKHLAENLMEHAKDEPARCEKIVSKVVDAITENEAMRYQIQSITANRKKNAFTVVWGDGSHTMIHLQPGDVWDDEKALAMCFVKHMMGDKGSFNDIFTEEMPAKIKHIGKIEPVEEKCECSGRREEGIHPCKDCSCHIEAEKAAEASVNAVLNKAGKAAEKVSNAMKRMIDELTDEPVKIQRYDLFLMDPHGEKIEIYHQGTDEEIHKAMRAYRKKHYPILEANKTPYRVWMVKDNLMVDFGAGSYFMVPGMDHDTFVKGK